MKLYNRITVMQKGSLLLEKSMLKQP